MRGMRQIRSRVMVFSLLFASIFPFASCADINGKDPYALWDIYEHERNLYHFRYLNPPWVFVETLEEQNRQLIAIDPRLERISYHIEQDNLHARIKVTIAIENWRRPEDAADEDIARYRSIARELQGPEPFMSARGHAGFKTSATFSDRRRVVAVYHALGNRRTVILRAAANESLNSADMTLLLKSLEPEAVDGD